MSWTAQQQRDRYAARRQAGLCVACPCESPKFARCSWCRQAWNTANNRWHLRSYYRHRDAVNMRRRAKYQEQHAA